MERDKVIIITSSRFPGYSGDTANFTEILNEMLSQNLDVILICPKVEGSNNKYPDVIPGLRTVRIPMTPPRLRDVKKGIGLVTYLRLLIYWIVEFITVIITLRRYEVSKVLIRHSIHTIQLPPLFKLMRAKVVADGEIISDLLEGTVSSWIESSLRRYEKKVIRYYSYYKVSTRSQIDSLVSFGYPSGRILLIPVGISLHTVPKFPILDIPNHTFGYFGVFEKWQGVDMLLQSFSILVKSQPSAILYLIGDGSLTSELKQMVVSRNLDNSVMFVGNISRKKLWEDYFKKFRIVVIPRPKQDNSVDFILPIKLVESLAAGKAVIASDIPAMKEIPENVLLLFESGNEVALAEAMKMLSDNDSLLAQKSQMSIKCSESFDVEAKTRQLIEALED